MMNNIDYGQRKNDLKLLYDKLTVFVFPLKCNTDLEIIKFMIFTIRCVLFYISSSSFKLDPIKTNGGIFCYNNLKTRQSQKNAKKCFETVEKYFKNRYQKLVHKRCLYCQKDAYKLSQLNDIFESKRLSKNKMILLKNIERSLLCLSLFWDLFLNKNRFSKVEIEDFELVISQLLKDINQKLKSIE